MSSFSFRKNKTFQDLLYLVPISLFFLLFKLGDGSLASWDEALYAVVAREIMESGHWLNLTFGGTLWFDKPPLALWATAGIFGLFGVNEFTARVFSALCGVGTVLVTYFLGRKLFNRWTAFCGAMVLLSTSHFLRCTRFGMLDSPFTFFFVLALYFFWLGQSRNRYLIFSGLAIGLAVMTKGFAGIMIFPIVWIYCWWSDRLEVLGRFSYWIGVLLAILIALPWNLYELIFHYQPFMDGVVFRHLVARTTSALDGHAGNFYFYIRTLVNKYHPWILVGIFSAPFFLWKAWRRREEEFTFIAVWMFFFFAVVTAMRTKLAWYIYPVYPALSLSVAYFFVKIFTEKYTLFVKIFFLTVMILHGTYSGLYLMDYSRPIKVLAPMIDKITPLGEKIYFYRYHDQPAGSFYLRRAIGYLETPDELDLALKKGKSPILVRDTEIPSLQSVLSKHGLQSAWSGAGFSLFCPTERFIIKSGHEKGFPKKDALI